MARGDFSKEIKEIETKALSLVEEVQCTKKQHYSEFFKWKIEQFGHALSQSRIDTLLFEKLASREEIQHYVKSDVKVAEVMSRWESTVEENKSFGKTIEDFLEECAKLPDGDEMMCVKTLKHIKQRTMNGWHH